ncbi:MAG: peptidase U32 family protein [Ignavibacteriaceae bacterium]
MIPNKQLPTASSQQPTPELMAPAGNRTMLSAVVKSGADAVYFGVDKLNMRAKATNFKLDELDEITSFCRKNKVKTYLTLNSIILEDELAELDEIISAAKRAGVDRIICWDLSVIQKCKEYEMPFCISTQASISNSLGVDFYKKLGSARVVLARECSLEEIKKIRERTDIEIEAFVHGAMCVAISGRCFMSHHLFGKSANQGECVQPCRREYEIYDKTIDKSLLIGEDYVLSPNDLCTIEFIDKLIEAGINSFKIEGRKRSPEYAAKVVSVYRKAIDLYYQGQLTENIKKDFLKELESVYNRGFSSGFYFGKPASADYSDIYGSKATSKKVFVGKVLNYYKKAQAAYISVDSGSLKLQDEILVTGPTTGVISLNLENIIKDDIKVETCSKGDKITFPCEETLRPRDHVYLVEKVKR